MGAERIASLRGVSVLGVAAAVLLVTSQASAFCRTYSTPPPPGFTPTPTPDGCFTEGVPVFHRSQCLPYRFLVKESAIVSNSTLSNAMGRAFAAWTAPNAVCAPGLTAIELPPIDAAKIAEASADTRGNNVIGVLEGPWPGNATSDDTLAKTTLTFNNSTGEILDADMEINGNVKWSFSATPTSDAYDFDSTITHEVGHMLGLTHTPDNDAVMNATYLLGSTTQRTLSNDDKRGICAIYPDRQTRAATSGAVASTACDLGPVQAGGSTCGDPEISRGCSTSAAPPTDGAWALPGAAAVLGLSVILRHRRRRHAR